MKKIKWDLILVGILIFVALISASFIGLFNNTPGDIVQVVNDETVICEYPLDIDKEYVIEYEEYFNTLVIKDSYAYISESNCPNQICVNHGSISKKGESIICLPHQLVIRVISSKDSVLDAISN